jgi:hypothetical protein
MWRHGPDLPVDPSADRRNLLPVWSDRSETMTLLAPTSHPQTQEPASDPPPEASRGRGWLLALIAGGILMRIILAAISWGANDANLFGEFGFFITRDGLMATYRGDPLLNHPPIPAYWCEIAWRLTVHFVSEDGRLYSDDNNWNTPGPWFSAVFKIPVLLAECATIWLLYRLWKEREGARRGLAVAAMYAWCLDAILVSGYHCNTDPIYAFLCLLSVYLAQDKRLHFWAGVALAAAINVKLTPVLLVPPLLLVYRDWRQAARFLAGLAVGVIPFIPVFYFAGHSFYENGIAYKSNLDRWGIPYLLMLHGSGADVYYNRGRQLVLVLIGLWAVTARLWGPSTVLGECDLSKNSATPPLAASQIGEVAVPAFSSDRDNRSATPEAAVSRDGEKSQALSPAKPDRYEVAAVTLAIFLFFASGFGVQYTVMVLPLMFAARPRMANLYGLLAGLFLLVVYWGHWTGRWPPDSQFHGYFPWPSPLWGLAAWGALGAYLLMAVSRLGRLSSAPGPGFPVSTKG